MRLRRGSEASASSARETEHIAHLVSVPLLLLSAVATGFALYFLQEILVPFVVAVFFVYLLRPLVRLLRRPMGSCLPCAGDEGVRSPPCPGSSLLRAFVPPSTEAVGGAAMVDPEGGDCMRPMPVGSTPRPRKSRRARALQALRKSRCPRWFAVLVSLCVAFAIMGTIALLIADAIQEFEVRGRVAPRAIRRRPSSARACRTRTWRTTRPKRRSWLVGWKCG